MSTYILPQTQTLRELERYARVLAARHKLPDASRHWEHVLEMIAENRINGTGDHLLRQAKAELARLNASNGHMHTVIYTDHIHHRYWLLDQYGSVIAAYPWSKDGKREVQVQQLRLECPQALSLALRAEERHPNLNGRALRGAQIAANGDVKATKTGYTVESQSNSHPYQVTTGDLTTCTCIDWRRGNNGETPGAPTVAGHVTCKHVIAVEIHVQLQKAR